MCYISGLMHDIGVMVFSYLVPEEYSAFIRDNRSDGLSLDVLEDKEFGINHAQLGALFVKKWWTLKPEVADAIIGHHADLSGAKNTSPVCRVVYIANYIANHFGFPNKIVDSEIEPFDEKKLLYFGISMNELQQIVDETREDLEATSEILYK